MLQRYDENLKNVKIQDDILDCETSIRAKMERQPFKTNRQRAENSLQLIHTDIMGPISPKSYPGNDKYIVTFTNDCSRLTRAYAIKSKDLAGDYLEKFLISSRNLSGKNQKLCYVRCDQTP